MKELRIIAITTALVSLLLIPGAASKASAQAQPYDPMETITVGATYSF
jgi:hypothetical protein